MNPRHQLLSDLLGIVDFDAQAPRRTLQVRVVEEEPGALRFLVRQ